MTFLKDLTSLQTDFTKKGDSRQLPPVVVNGVRADIVSAFLWIRFKIFKLIHNMRLRNSMDKNETRQRNYAQTMLVIREGRDDNDYAPVL